MPFFLACIAGCGSATPQLQWPPAVASLGFSRLDSAGFDSAQRSSPGPQGLALPLVAGSRAAVQSEQGARQPDEDEASDPQVKDASREELERTRASSALELRIDTCKWSPKEKGWADVELQVSASQEIVLLTSPGKSDFWNGSYGLATNKFLIFDMQNHVDNPERTVLSPGDKPLHFQLHVFFPESDRRASASSEIVVTSTIVSRETETAFWSIPFTLRSRPSGCRMTQEAPARRIAEVTFGDTYNSWNATLDP